MQHSNSSKSQSGVFFFSCWTICGWLRLTAADCGWILHCPPQGKLVRALLMSTFHHRVRSSRIGIPTKKKISFSRLARLGDWGWGEKLGGGGGRGYIAQGCAPCSINIFLLHFHSYKVLAPSARESTTPCDFCPTFVRYITLPPPRTFYMLEFSYLAVHHFFCDLTCSAWPTLCGSFSPSSRFRCECILTLLFLREWSYFPPGLIASLSLPLSALFALSLRVPCESASSPIQRQGQPIEDGWHVLRICKSSGEEAIA